MNEIDVACIKETHNDRNDRQTYTDYTIFYSAADKAIQNRNNNTHWGNNWRGVAIITKNDYVDNIKPINRVYSRIIGIKLKHGIN